MVLADEGICEEGCRMSVVYGAGGLKCIKHDIGGGCIYGSVSSIGSRRWCSLRCRV